MGRTIESEREVIIDTRRAHGCAFSVDSIGNYDISFRSVEPGVAGPLAHSSGLSFAAEIEGDNFFAIAGDAGATETPTAAGSGHFTVDLVHHLAGTATVSADIRFVPVPS
jgi:hypothetical protein